jgi:addiction module RelE/StbE family toxin
MKKINKIDYSPSFDKQFRKAPSHIQKQALSRIKTFSQNPLHPQLKNHPLKGGYKNLRSININGDWRALYKEVESEGEIIAIFEFLGTHAELYD